MSEVDRQNGFLFPGCECSHLCPGDCDPEECACGWYNARIAALTAERDAAREQLAIAERRIDIAVMAMRSITARHPGSPPGEHPAVDICVDALARILADAKPPTMPQDLS